jgi:hypothetical protein
VQRRLVHRSSQGVAHGVHVEPVPSIRYFDPIEICRRRSAARIPGGRHRPQATVIIRRDRSFGGSIVAAI